jgi:hypothetical protein
VDCSQAAPLLPEYFPLIYLSFFFPSFLYFDLNHVAGIFLTLRQTLDEDGGLRPGKAI